MLSLKDYLYSRFNSNDFLQAENRGLIRSNADWKYVHDVRLSDEVFAEISAKQRRRQRNGINYRTILFTALEQINNFGQNWREYRFSRRVDSFSEPGITFLESDGKRIYIGFGDGTIKVCSYNMLTNFTFRPHRHQITSLNFRNNYLYTTSTGMRINMFEFVDNTLTMRLVSTYHDQACINCARFYQNQFLVSYSMLCLTLYRVEGTTFTHIRNFVTLSIQQTVDFNDHYIIGINGWDNRIMVWRTNSFEPIGPLEGHNDTVTGIRINDHQAISVCWDNTIRYCLR